MRWQPLGLLRVVLDAVHGAGDLFLPAACAACDGVLGLGARALCAACRTSIAAQAPARCHRCGSSRSPLLAASRRCPRCRGRALGFRWAAVGGSYEGALRRLVLRLKYGPEPRLAPLVVALVLPQLGPAVQQHAVDALVPVPLHRRRQRLRGFNQAELVARELARHWHLPVWPLLRRRVESSAQAGLPRRHRLHNVAAVFSPRHVWGARVRGSRLAVVDDVISTGATIDACARQLKRLGAREVGAIALAAAL